MDVQQIWVQAAARVAERLHYGQIDKAGVDYFQGHLSTVASLGRTWKEKVVGYLHDAREDTPYSLEQILTLLEEEAQVKMDEEVKEEIKQALHLLNHHLASDRESYIRGIASHSLARAVKMNDLTHNMDLQRLPAPTAKDYQRLERYRREYEYLSRQG